MSKLVSMSMFMYLSTVIRNMLLVLLSMLSSSTMCMSIGISMVVSIGTIYLEAGPSGDPTPKRPNYNHDI